jgi:hypothetical protein
MNFGVGIKTGEEKVNKVMLVNVLRLLDAIDMLLWLAKPRKAPLAHCQDSELWYGELKNACWRVMKVGEQPHHWLGNINA